MRLLSHARLLMFTWHLVCAWCMFQKRKAPDSPEGDNEAQKLKAEIEDMFLSGDISGPRTQRLAKRGLAWDPETFQALRNIAQKGRKKNLNRDLTRKMLKDKGKTWPSLYWAHIRVWSPKKRLEEKVLLPFLLPHELLAALAKRAGSTNSLFTKEGMSDSARKHLEAVNLELGVENLVGLGLWGDGVPCNYDRSQSLEAFSLNLPGTTGGNSNLRLAICGVNKRFLLKNHTVDDVLEVIKWSLQHCAAGIMPAQRHDVAPWRTEDHKRRKAAGLAFPPGALCEIRGDWQFYKTCFRLPQHNEKAGICWRCSATPSTYKDCSSSAPWRSERLSHWQLLRRMQEQGHLLSPIFGAPGVRSSIFQVDWLHCADKFVTADFLGQLFYQLLDKLPGNNQEARVDSLFKEIQDWYRLHPQDSQLDNLTLRMIKPQKCTPSLSCKAAECRNLVGFGLAASTKWLSQEDTFEKTV